MLLILQLFWGVASAESLAPMIIDDRYNSRGKASFFVQTELSEIEFENDSGAEIERTFSSKGVGLGLKYGLGNEMSIELSQRAIFDHEIKSNKALTEDPIITFWKRTYSPVSESDFYRDIGFEFTPHIVHDDYVKTDIGNKLLLKFRFGASDPLFHTHASYYLGLQESRVVKNSSNVSKVDASTCMGLNLVSGVTVLDVWTFGGRIDLTWNSEHSGKLYFTEENNSSSWETLLQFYSTYSISEKYHIMAFFRSSNESPTFNKFASKNNLEVENQSLGISFYVKNF